MVKIRTADGQRLVYPPGDDVADFLNAGWYEFREQAFFYRFLRKGDRFLDIGAHCGLYSAIARPIVGKTGYVLAIEPGADLVDFLTRNLHVPGYVEKVQQLKGEGCEWLRAAVMDQPGVVYLSGQGIEKSAYRDVHTGGEAGYAVTAVTGDQISEHLGRRFDLIKIDVEGAEVPVLAGLLGMLLKYPETVLMVEFTEANQSRHQASTEALARRIREMGLGLYEFDGIACQLVPVEANSDMEHKNLFACRNPDAVNERLKSAPAKQVLHAEEVFQRGRASERLYSETLLFKNFRVRGADWLGQIAGSLRHLRGDSEDVSERWRELAANNENAPSPQERARGLAGLIEDGLGQLEGTAAYLADSLETERRKHAVLKRQFEEAEALIVQDMRLEAPNLEVAIRAGMEMLASDLLLLQEVGLALPDTQGGELAIRLKAYSGRLHREMAETLSNRIELQRLKPVVLAASQQLREARARDAQLEAALAEAEAKLSASEKELGELNASNLSQKDQLASSRAHESALEASLAEAQAKLSASEKELGELNASNLSLKDQLASSRAHESALEASLAEAQAGLEDRDAALSELRARIDDEVIGKLSAAEARAATLEDELAEVKDSLRAEQARFEEMIQETGRLLSELNEEHNAELGDLREAVTDAKAIAAQAEAERTAALAEVSAGKAQLANMAVIIGESARELSNLAHGTSSDHDVIRDLVRSVRASRVALLAAVAGIGPRRATSQLMTQTASARAKISEILLKADFLKSVAKEAETCTAEHPEIDISRVDDGWSVYRSAIEKHGRGRRAIIGACAHDDMRAIGQSVDALRRSRFMKIASMLGLQASKELDKLYEIYCARQAD